MVPATSHSVSGGSPLRTVGFSRDWRLGYSAGSSGETIAEVDDSTAAVRHDRCSMTSEDSSPAPFDRLAEAATRVASRGAFFAACVLLVVVWLPSYFAIRNLDTWQLIINTATTIVTFLLVALLQNASRRSDRAIHRKLDALADGSPT